MGHEVPKHWELQVSVWGAISPPYHLIPNEISYLLIQGKRLADLWQNFLEN